MGIKNEIALEDYPLAQQYRWYRFGYRIKSPDKPDKPDEPRKPRHYLTPDEEKAIAVEYLNRSGGSSRTLLGEMASQYDISFSYMYRIAKSTRSELYQTDSYLL